MANPITDALATGTLGELLVQLRLLELGVQAAPPLKDSGNDLVAFLGRSVRTIQVKTSVNRLPRDRRLPEHYDILALVKLDRTQHGLRLDRSSIYLIPESRVAETQRTAGSLEPWLLSQGLVGALFTNPCAAF